MENTSSISATPDERLFIREYFDLHKKYESLKEAEDLLDLDQQIAKIEEKTSDVSRKLRKYLAKKEFLKSPESFSGEMHQLFLKLGIARHISRLFKSKIFAFIAILFLIRMGWQVIAFFLFFISVSIGFLLLATNLFIESNLKEIDKEIDVCNTLLRKFDFQKEELLKNRDTAKEKRSNLCNFLESKISGLEDRLERFLESDRKLLLKRAASKLYVELDLEHGSHKLEGRALEKEPIVFFWGVESDRKSSRGLISNRDLPELESKLENLLTPTNFESRKSFTRNRRYYTIYCFTALFLGRSSLSYYRCWWDLLKGEFIDPEACEYFYDSITSIKTHEKISLKQKDSDRVRTYWDALSITTSDGKTLYVLDDRDRSRRISSAESGLKDPSDLQSAATTIREWLRYRRVD